MEVENMIDKKFHKLEVIEETYRPKHVKTPTKYFICQCECGNIKTVSGGNLRSGQVKSCGCIRIKKNNIRNHILYNVWKGMKARCYNINHTAYHNYGGRNIIICSKWYNSFESFFYWCMNNEWKKGLSIDRIDNDGNYYPENCRFVTRKEQGRNKRTNLVFKIGGVEKTVIELSEEYGINQFTLYDRLRRGWDIDKAINTPVRRQKCK